MTAYVAKRCVFLTGATISELTRALSWLARARFASMCMQLLF